VANEIGSGSGACARQGRGVRRRGASFRSCSSLGFGLLEENKRAVQRFARLCLLSSVKDNQSVDEKSLGPMNGLVRTEARSSGKLRRDITT